MQSANISESSLGSIFPVAIAGFLNYAFIPSIIFFLIELVKERNEKVKETLRMMGMSQTVYWVSWYITVAVSALFVSLMAVICGKLAFIFMHSNLFIVFLFFVLYAASIIAFAFLMR